MYWLRKKVSNYNSLRCRKCNDKYRTGNKSQNWKNGKPKCVNCGKQLLHYGNLRCIKCYRKHNSGKNRPNWKSKRPKCIDCGKELVNNNILRCNACYRKYSIGNKSPSWKGGISYETYCPTWTDKEFKQAIRNRDNNTTYDIGYWWKGELSIHHIDYNKKNCNPDNLITVSTGMNSSANFDREWHTEWFQTLMKHRNKIKNLQNKKARVIIHRP